MRCACGCDPSGSGTSSCSGDPRALNASALATPSARRASGRLQVAVGWPSRTPPRGRAAPNERRPLSPALCSSVGAWNSLQVGVVVRTEEREDGGERTPGCLEFGPIEEKIDRAPRCAASPDRPLGSPFTVLADIPCCRLGTPLIGRRGIPCQRPLEPSVPGRRQRDRTVPASDRRAHESLRAGPGRARTDRLKTRLPPTPVGARRTGSQDDQRSPAASGRRTS